MIKLRGASEKKLSVYSKRMDITLICQLIGVEKVKIHSEARKREARKLGATEL